MGQQFRPPKKSRGGCARCKKRRIKCDETRPSCHMCRTNRAECPGYERPLKWLAKHQQYLPPTSDPLARRHGSLDRETRRDLDLTIPPRAEARVVSPHDSLDQISPELEADSIPDASLWPSIDAWDFEDLGLFNIPLIENTATPVQLSETSMILESIYGNNRVAVNPDLAALEQQLVQQRNYGLPNRADSSTNTSDVAQQKTFAAGRSRFLETYYRLSMPGRDFGLSDHDFVNHYFQNVCALISCFDSDLNLFRSIAMDLYPSSATVHLAIQSMSIGHLSNYYPQLATIGLQKRSQAWQLLQRDLYSHRIGRISTDTVLFSLLLLGLSAPWIQPSNTGMQYLVIARNTVLENLQGTGSRLRNAEFFQNALMYWEMLASFIDPVPMTPLPGKLDPPQATSASPSERILPHPWTGLLTDVSYALAEVGRILARHRAQVKTDCNGDEPFRRSEREWASYLERFLVYIVVPAEDSVADYGDARTPRIDLILAAEACRMVGLLELYAIFPHLLPKDEQQMPGFYDHFGKGMKPSPAYKSDIDARLVSIAGRILELVKPIAISSAACRLLPLVFVACSSYLRFPDSTTSLDESRGEQYETIVQARSVVEAKMLVMSRKYAQAPMLQLLLTAKEVWQRLDDGDESAHWVSTMHEKGWQTLVG